ncbi:hypothetical protein [Rhodanobacter sp. C06]|uniref:hypothetical protein n=1 Tax=Rhodanobacter sp. C06 TaxID=1945854 RepID=UPI001115AD2B|nr:hypothetical protein [Rhodanobacter sp. C06]
MSEANIVTLFPKVFSFTYKQNQDIVPPEATNAEIENYIKVGAIRAWKYVPWISLKNDGKTDDVVVWQGSGVYPGLSGNARCGEVNEVMDPPDGARTEQIILVLSGEGNAIDEQETRRLFGNPGPSSLYIRAFKGVDGVSPFGPLGHEMGLMKYKGTSYIYVFGAAAQSSQISKSDQAEKRIWSEALNTLSLYRWVGDANREVARYAMTVTH